MMNCKRGRLLLKENVLASEKSEEPQNVRRTSDNVVLHIIAYFTFSFDRNEIAM